VAVVNLIESLDGAVHKLLNKICSNPLSKKYDNAMSFNSENGTKVEKPARDFDSPRTTLTTILQRKDNDFSLLVTRVYTKT